MPDFLIRLRKYMLHGLEMGVILNTLCVSYVHACHDSAINCLGCYDIKLICQPIINACIIQRYICDLNPYSKLCKYISHLIRNNRFGFDLHIITSKRIKYGNTQEIDTNIISYTLVLLE